MREFHEVLSEAFDEHAAVLARDPERQDHRVVVADIRRKRGWRTAGTAAGATLGIFAVALAAPRIVADAIHESPVVGATSDVTMPREGAPAWCDLSAYPAPNPESYGPARYLGRVYSNFETQEYHHVAPDGTVTRLEANADGEVVYQPEEGPPTYAYLPNDGSMPWTTLVMDSFGGGGGGGGPYLGPDGHPQLAYEWTTVAPADVPDGIDPALLAEVHTLTLGFSGTGLEPNVAGADAVVESVFTWEDGTQDVVRIHRGEPGASIRNYDGLVSAAIRATLPSGEAYEITSYYDASMTYEAACGPVPGSDVQAAPEPQQPEFNYGPYLLGPESSLFACGATLPAGMEGDPEAIEHRQGSFYDVNETGIEFDFGEHGFALTTTEKYFPGHLTDTPPYPGWGGGTYEEDDGNPQMRMTYVAFVWVDAEDTIIARQVATDPDLDTSRIRDASESIRHISNGTRQTMYVGDIDDLAVACEGVDAGALGDASLAVIVGQGPGPDAMEWEIYRP